MFKQISVMKRHPSLTPAEFRANYEGRHARFGETLFANARRFVRRYVQPETNPLTGEVSEPDFDVILEIWWDSRADFEEAMRGVVSSPDLPAIRESGARLFASQNSPSFAVEECDTVLARGIV
jgi:hypothetical protein